MRDFHNTKTFCKIIKTSFIAASIEESGFSAEIDPIFLKFFETANKIAIIEKHLVTNNDYWLNYVLDESYILLEVYYNLSKDKLEEILPQDIDNGSILANFCIKSVNEAIAVSGFLKKARSETRNILLNKIVEYSADPLLSQSYQTELEEFDLLNCHRRNTIGAFSDEFEESDNMARVSAAISNPNKISLNSLGPEKHREKICIDHFSTYPYIRTKWTHS